MITANYKELMASVELNLEKTRALSNSGAVMETRNSRQLFVNLQNTFDLLLGGEFCLVESTHIVEISQGSGLIHQDSGIRYGHSPQIVVDGNTSKFSLCFSRLGSPVLRDLVPQFIVDVHDVRIQPLQLKSQDEFLLLMQ